MFWSIVIRAYFKYIGQAEKCFLGFSVRYHLDRREEGEGKERRGREEWEKEKE